jgi:hypothetical protein
MPLDESSDNPMYVIGRAWAVCEAAIKEANMVLPRTSMVNDPNQGFVAVHAKFMQALAELRSERKPDRVQFYEDLMTTLMNRLEVSAFPLPMLSDQQGPLEVGYWHQHAALEAGR